MILRGTLFRKYVVYFVTLVTVALVASGGIGVYFTYKESKAALLDLQREKAAAAASRIEAYVSEIEHQIGWMRLPQVGASNPEQRRFDYLKLLRQVPAITDVIQVDRTGQIKLRVSRLGMDVAGGGEDLSNDPKFTVPKSGKTYFSPVYFRKETEPYMTISMAGISDEAGITIAEVNLKFIWDVISRIKIGEKGLAYAIDSQGHLIAHPDISQVLQKSDLATLPQIKAALSPQETAGERVTIARNLQGGEVLSAYASIPSLGWHVFVEQSIAEAFAPLYESLKRTGVLLLAGLVLSVLASLFVARRMVEPIRAVTEGAGRIGAGNLDQAIEVHTGDELEALANQFNTMAARLKDSYAGLEKKVDERTRELTETLEQQTATSEILSVISNSPTNVQPVFEAIVQSALRLFDGNVIGVLLVNGDRLERPAFVSTENRQVAQDFYPMPLDRASLAGRAILDHAFIHMADITTETDVPERARTLADEIGYRAVMVSPMTRENTVIGAIAVCRPVAGAFTDKQIALLKTFADQAVISIENVRLFNETKEALEQQTATSEILSVISNSPTNVQPVFDAIVRSGVRLFEGSAVAIVLPDGEFARAVAIADSDPVRCERWMKIFPVPLTREYLHGAAILDSRMIDIPDNAIPTGTLAPGTSNFVKSGYRAITLAPMLRDGTAIGVISVVRVTPGPLSDKQVALLQTFADQAVIAIENVRLFNEIQTIPIVMGQSGDPVAMGAVKSLAHPGGNVTGMTTLSTELPGKQAELLKELVPQLSRLAVMFNPANPLSDAAWKHVRRTAQALHLQLQNLSVKEAKDLAGAFAAMTKGRADGLVVLPDPMFLSQRTQIAELAAKSKLPAIYGIPEHAEAGGLIAYAASRTESFRRATTFIDKILKGAKPADLPVEQPTKFELVINMKTAKALGIKFPNSILVRADKVIE